MQHLPLCMARSICHMFHHLDGIAFPHLASQLSPGEIHRLNALCRAVPASRMGHKKRPQGENTAAQLVTSSIAVCNCVHIKHPDIRGLVRLISGHVQVITFTNIYVTYIYTRKYVFICTCLCIQSYICIYTCMYTDLDGTDGDSDSPLQKNPTPRAAPPAFLRLDTNLDGNQRWRIGFDKA